MYPNLLRTRSIFESRFRLRFLTVAVLLSLLVGCATTQPRNRTVEKEVIRQALTAMQQNERSFRELKAFGTLNVRTENDIVYKLRGRLEYRPFRYLMVRGDKLPLGTKALELIAEENEWALILPFENITLRSTEMPPRTPRVWRNLQPAQEFFCFGFWEGLSEKDIRVVRIMGDSVMLKIPQKGMVRRVTLAQNPWRVTQSVLETRFGRKIISFEYNDFDKSEEVVLPRVIRTLFYPAKLRMEFDQLQYRLTPLQQTSLLR